jgi:hypothetical protein
MECYVAIKDFIRNVIAKKDCAKTEWIYFICRKAGSMIPRANSFS